MAAVLPLTWLYQIMSKAGSIPQECGSIRNQWDDRAVILVPAKFNNGPAPIPGGIEPRSHHRICPQSVLGFWHFFTLRWRIFRLGDDILVNMDETDLELLQRFVHHNAEDAFAQVVHRHLALVHSAALRQVRSSHLAQEIAQSVFIDLARNASRLPRGTVLVAWLYQVTRRTAIDVVRCESRRELREQIAHERNVMNSTNPSWTQIEPLLEQAMETLEADDRTAVLLRYFENKSLREVGDALGFSENAAQKRLGRAIERLRRFFGEKGITVGASGLAVLLSINAVQATPFQMGAGIAALAAQASIAAAQAGAAVAGNLAAGTIQTVFMSITQKAIVAATLIAIVGTAIFESQQISRLRAHVQQLESQMPLETVEQIAQERGRATEQLNSLTKENEQLKRNAAELLRPRAEVTRLKSEAQAAVPGNSGSVSTENAAKDWLARVNQLKERVARTPGANVPELRLLTEEDWLGAVQNPKLDTEKDYRRAMSGLRGGAQNKFAALAQPALHKYLKENDWKFPTDLSQLQSYFEGGPVERDILQRFGIVPAESVSNVQMGGEWAISQMDPVDAEFDSRLVIGPRGYGSTDWKSRDSIPSSDVDLLSPALKAFTEGNNGHEPSDISQLQPYLKTDAEQKAFQRVLQAHVGKVEP